MFTATPAINIEHVPLGTREADIWNKYAVNLSA